MRRAVDAEREPGHHAHARTREVASELERDVVTVTSAPARADDGRARAVERIEVAAVKQHARWVVVVRQRDRIPVMPEHPDADAVGRVARPVLGDIGRTCGPAPFARDASRSGSAGRLDSLVSHRPALDHACPRVVGRPGVEQRRDPAGTHRGEPGERGREPFERRALATHEPDSNGDGTVRRGP